MCQNCTATKFVFYVELSSVKSIQQGSLLSGMDGNDDEIWVRVSCANYWNLSRQSNKSIWSNLNANELESEREIDLKITWQIVQKSVVFC